MEMYIFLDKAAIHAFIFVWSVFPFQTCLLNRISKILLLFDLQQKVKAEEPKNLELAWVNGLSKAFPPITFQ